MAFEPGHQRAGTHCGALRVKRVVSKGGRFPLDVPTTLALLTSFLLFSLTPLRAQDPVNRINRFARAATELTQVDETAEGNLASGEEAVFRAELVEGTEYMVLAFCDDDCSDLDLVLLDPDRVGVESDILPDAEPVLAFTASSTGTFRMRVAMVTCAQDPCGFALGVFEGSIQEGLGITGAHMVERLSRFREELLSEGYSELPMQESGTLYQARELRFPLTLEEGIEYQIVGVCDNDCNDLNLILYDPRGGMIAVDAFTDAIPVLSVSTERSEVLLVGVTMEACPMGPCQFQVAIFGKGDRIGPGGVMLPGRVVSATTREGVLEEGDELLEGGEYSDAYSVDAEAGQLIIVDLRSSDFNTFLVMESPGGTQERSQGFQGDQGHSHLATVAREAGTFTVVVTSSTPEAVGSYILQLAVAEGPPGTPGS